MNEVDILNLMSAMMLTQNHTETRDTTWVKSQKELRTPEQSEYLIKKAAEKRARRAKR